VSLLRRGTTNHLHWARAHRPGPALFADRATGSAQGLAVIGISVDDDEDGVIDLICLTEDGILASEIEPLLAEE
jgi:hypothetical protein